MQKDSAWHVTFGLATVELHYASDIYSLTAKTRVIRLPRDTNLKEDDRNVIMLRRMASEGNDILATWDYEPPPAPECDPIADQRMDAADNGH